LSCLYTQEPGGQQSLPDVLCIDGEFVLMQNFKVALTPDIERYVMGIFTSLGYSTDVLDNGISMKLTRLLSNRLKDETGNLNLPGQKLLRSMQDNKQIKLEKKDLQNIVYALFVQLLTQETLLSIPAQYEDVPVELRLDGNSVIDVTAKYREVTLISPDDLQSAVALLLKAPALPDIISIFSSGQNIQVNIIELMHNLSVAIQRADLKVLDTRMGFGFADVILAAKACL
jgi:hypothetical protein